MTNFLTEDISISKKTFFRLFISYSLIFFISVSVVTTFYLSFLSRFNISPWIYCFLWLGITCGTFLTMLVIEKCGSIRWVWAFDIIGGIVFLGFLLYPIIAIPIIFIIILLFVPGFLIGGSITQTFIMVGVMTKIEERGRIIGILNTLGGIILLIFTILMIFFDFMYQAIIIGIAYVITGCLNMIFLKDLKIKEIPDETKIESEAKKRDFFFYFIIVFLICNMFGLMLIQVTFGLSHEVADQLGSLLFGSGITIWGGMEPIMVYLSISIIGSSPILGLISDKFGRKIVWIISISTCFIGAFLYGFFLNPPLLIVFGIVVGITLSLTLGGLINFIADSISFKKIVKCMGILFGIGFIFGMNSGALIGILIIPYPIINITFVVLFLLGFCYIIIIYSQETLPSKKERQWFARLNHLYIIAPAGILLYNYSFKPHMTDAELIAGGISGICSLVQELTMSKSELKVIKQEQATIIINSGAFVTSALIVTEDLKILHQKLEAFTKEFEKFFGELLKTWIGDRSAFLPTKIIVERLFEVEKFGKLQKNT